MFKVFGKKDFLAFVIGVLTLIQFRFVGTLGVAEIIAIASFPFIKPFKLIRSNLMLKKLSRYILLGIAGLVFANLLNNTSYENSIKGIFFQLIFYLLFPFAYWLLKDNYRRVLFFLSGLALSNIIAFLFYPTSALKSQLLITQDISQLLNIWFIYFIQPSAVFFASILYFKSKRKLAILFIISFAIFALFEGSRNIFLVWMLASLILLLIGNINYNFNISSSKYRALGRRLPLLVISAIILMIGMKYTYEYLADNGSLGERAQYKYLKQKNSSGLGILTSRVEFLIGLHAILENPIIGYGSYPNDNSNLKYRVYNLYDIDDSDVPYNDNEDRLSGHSHILNGYIYSGILGLFFWLYALRLVLFFLKKTILYDTKMIGFFVIIILSWLWDLFFSPFAYRMQEAIMLVTIIIVIQKVKLIQINNQK